MSTEALEEMREAIDHYDRCGYDWTSVVTYIGIKHLFGGWQELQRGIRRPWKGERP
jgi:hypothetical protein